MYLTCELSKERDVIWKKNGVEIKPVAGKIAINIIGLLHSLTIQGANDDDAAAYTCECENLKTATTVKIIGTAHTVMHLPQKSPSKLYLIGADSLIVNSHFF